MAVGAQPSNLDLRALMLGTALRRSIMVNPPQSYTVGGQLQVPLPHAGIGRKVRVTASIPVTITGTVATTSKGPYNFFTTVRLTDYSGIDRVSCSAYMLYLLSVLKRRAYEPSLPGDGLNSASFGYFASSRFNYPTASGTVVFHFDIPLALNELDPRGSGILSVPGTSTNWVLYLQCAPTLVADRSTTPTSDAPYTANGGIPGTNNVALNGTPTITVAYYYWDPVQVPGLQTPGSVPVPYGDLSLIHEYRGVTVTSGIAANQETQYPLPTGRDYYRALVSVNENGANAISHITQFRHLYDGATPSMQEYLQAYCERVAEEFGRDMPDGLLFYDWTQRPWDSNAYGVLALGVLPSNAFTNTGNTYLEIGLESLYLATMAAA